MWWLFLIFLGGVEARESVNDYVTDLLNNDPQKAKKFLKSKLDDPYCCYLFGSILLTEKNIKLADIYITRAANYNLPEALNSLGDGYYSGDIRPKNIKMALHYYIKAAKLNYWPGQFNTGAVYLRHFKTKRDLRKALYWFNTAEKQVPELKPYIAICKERAKDELKNFKRKR